MSAGVDMPAAAALAAGVFRGLDDAAVAALCRQYRATGCAAWGPPGLLPGPFAALQREAAAQLRDQAWTLTGERRHGEIAQHNRRARLGPVARAYLASEAAVALLHAATGEWLQPSWSASCYTRYGAGEFMGEHCDKPEACAYTLLTYLHAAWPPGQPPGIGLQLIVYRGDNAGTGEAARVSSLPGRVVMVNGARQAHVRPPLAPGESLCLLAGCYRRVSP